MAPLPSVKKKPNSFHIEIYDAAFKWGWEIV